MKDWGNGEHREFQSTNEASIPNNFKSKFKNGRSIACDFSLFVKTDNRNIPRVPCFWSNFIATSHDRFPPKGSCLEGKWDPLFQGNLG